MATSTTPDDRTAIRAMYVGLALTVVALALPFVDQATTGLLADHVRAGYPAFTPAEIATAVSTWTVVLATVGGLGVVGWVVAIRAAHRGRRWTRWYAAAMLVAAAGVALAGLTIPDTSGEVGLAPLLGWVGMLPVLAGGAVVAQLWRRAPRPVKAA